MRLVSPTEVDRKEFKGLYSYLKPGSMLSSIPEKCGADVVSMIRNQGMLAIQRKVYPDDFIASIQDGRMAKEVILIQKARFLVWVLEGEEPMYTTDGNLMDPYLTRWTREGLHNAEHSLWWVHGIRPIHTKNMQGTADLILELEGYLSKGQHLGFMNRPKHYPTDSWGVVAPEDKASFFLQGFDRIGDKTAKAIFNHFGKRVPMRWDCTLEELMEVPGVGKSTAKKLLEEFDVRE